MHGASNDFVKELSKQSREFCIIGLTGKVRSGTSDVCKLLTSDKFPDYMALPATNHDDLDEDAREYRIIYRYIRENWKPFIELNVSGVIASFLLEADTNLLQKETPLGAKIFAIIKELSDPASSSTLSFWANVSEKVTQTITNLLYPAQCIDSSQQYQTEVESFKKAILRCQNDQIDCFKKWKAIKQFIESNEKTFNTDLESTKEKYRDTLIFCFGILPALDETLNSQDKFRKLKNPLFM